MSASVLVALLVVLATAVGLWTTARDGRAHRAWRIALHPAVALSLYLLLFPPLRDRVSSAGELVVLTPGATAEQRAAHAGDAVVALPGVEATRDVARVPDLATALRIHPERGQLRVVGGGLPLRDRDAARGRVVAFEAAPLPEGIVALAAPRTVVAGARWSVRGRAQGLGMGRIVLHDPAGTPVAETRLDDEGRFVLTGEARAAGEAVFELRAIAANGRELDRVTLPLVATPGRALRVVLLAGSADPTLKYLHRWMRDAGLEVRARLHTRPDLAVQTSDAPDLTRDGLRDTDLLIVDERAWATLTAAQRIAIGEAVRDGMGLLLRITGALPATVASDWARYGFAFESKAPAFGIVLDTAEAAAANGPTLSTSGVVDGSDAATVLVARGGMPLSAWRLHGAGRVGYFALADAWKLVTTGHGTAHATLWSRVFAALARTRDVSAPEVPERLRVHERAILFGLSAAASITARSGATTALHIGDAGSATPGCAAWWPAEAGWHRLRSGDAEAPLYVRDDSAASPLARGDALAATQALGRSGESSAQVHEAQPISRWPFFFAFALLAFGLWWLERPRSQSGAS